MYVCASAGTCLKRKRGFGACTLYFVLFVKTWTWGICVYVTLLAFARTVNVNLEHQFYVVHYGSSRCVWVCTCVADSASFWCVHVDAGAYRLCAYTSVRVCVCVCACVPLQAFAGTENVDVDNAYSTSFGCVHQHACVWVCECVRVCVCCCVHSLELTNEFGACILNIVFVRTSVCVCCVYLCSQLLEPKT